MMIEASDLFAWAFGFICGIVAFILFAWLASVVAENM